ncbi:Crp/Fnr family transcriptional regulator [Candidatus Neomarinimicrobiota bacterium]
MSLLEERLKRQFKKGEIIFKDGQTGQTMFIVLQGQVEISKMLGDQKTVLASLEPGSVFGEMAIIDSQPRSATAIASSNVVLLEIGREMFRKRMEEVPKWLQAFFGIVVERLRTATKNQSILLTQGAGRQVVNLLAMFAKQAEPDSAGTIFLPWAETLTSIGFYVGLNEERVNDTMNKLVSLHLAASDRREGFGRVFLLEDPKRFCKFAEYCHECHLFETGHLKEMSEAYRFQNKEEVELLLTIQQILADQGAVEDFPATMLEEHISEQYKKSFKVYESLIDGYIQEGIMDKFQPEGAERSYRINNKDLLLEKIAKVQLLADFRELDKNLLG